jgi:hypothetical protein
MRRIFLHAGQTKTGTTSVQNFLGRRRDQLLELGYLYPSEGCSHIFNHGPLVSAILGEKTPPKHADAAESLKRTIGEHRDASVIISAERVFRYLRVCVTKKIENPRLLSFLLETGLPLTVISYIRPREESLNSRYVQGVKSFLIDLPFDEYIRKELEQNATYAQMPELARPPQITMVFRPFNADVQRVGVVADFLSTVGLRDDEIESLGDEPRVNESIGPIALTAAQETLRRIRREGGELTQAQRDRLRARLFELISQEDPEPSFFGVDADIAKRVKEHFAEDAQRFAKAAWGTSWEAVFPPEPERRRRSNVFDLRTAEPQAVERHGRLRDELWATASAILADQKLGQARPWDHPGGPEEAGKALRKTRTREIRSLEGLGVESE